MQDQPEQQWPAVGAAYDFVLPSYQLLTSRYEAADTRLNSLLTFISAMIVGLPVLARAIHPSITFKSPLFIAAVSLLIVAALVGIGARLTGTLLLVHPGVLWKESLHESEWEFKKNAVLYAGRHFQKNAAAIEQKAVAATITSLIMLVALVLAVIWLSW